MWWSCWQSWQGSHHHHAMHPSNGPDRGTAKPTDAAPTVAATVDRRMQGWGLGVACSSIWVRGGCFDRLLLLVPLAHGGAGALFCCALSGCVMLTWCRMHSWFVTPGACCAGECTACCTVDLAWSALLRALLEAEPSSKLHLCLLPAGVC
jgi:hypothetical protein